MVYLCYGTVGRQIYLKGVYGRKFNISVSELVRELVLTRNEYFISSREYITTIYSD